MGNGQMHNWNVAWIRMWGAIAAQYLADSTPPGYAKEIAAELATFQIRRANVAFYALETIR